MGQNPVSPVNIPITKIGSKMGGGCTYQPKWDPKTRYRLKWVLNSPIPPNGIPERFGPPPGDPKAHHPPHGARAWPRPAPAAPPAARGSARSLPAAWLARSARDAQNAEAGASICSDPGKEGNPFWGRPVLVGQNPPT